MQLHSFSSSENFNFLKDQILEISCIEINSILTKDYTLLWEAFCKLAAMPLKVIIEGNETTSDIKNID